MTYVGVTMDHQLQEIGARLKQARLARKLSQPQLAEAADISVSFLSNLENGRQVMNIKTLISLTDALNISADWLLGTARIQPTTPRHWKSKRNSPPVPQRNGKLFCAWCF